MLISGIDTNKKYEKIIELRKLLFSNNLDNNLNMYLISLIDLDISVIREYITKEERETLSNLELYRKIAIYNIYIKALNLTKSLIKPFCLYNNWTYKRLNINAKIGNNIINLFQFDYSDKSIIGNIKLYQSLDGRLKTLTPEEKRELYITRYIHNLFMEDYALTDKDFKESKTTTLGEAKIKTLKEMPLLTIENNTKYL